MNNIIWKLLRQHISKGQLIGFAIANLIGLTIVLLAVQFYRDVRPVFNDEESFISKDYLIITRAVTGAGAMMGSNGEFSDDDISDLESQPWCRQVGRFLNSDFAVDARLGVGSGHAMHTQFFFEAIPDEFIDIDPNAWGFNPNDPVVPVVISRDYLSLYNFGFAATQGMPKISEGQAEMLPLEFTLSGNGQRLDMPGRIVGFSNRLNTVIVPQEFMEWANQRFGTGEIQHPQRLIVEVNRVVTSCRSYFQSSLDALLTFDVREVKVEMVLLFVEFLTRINDGRLVCRGTIEEVDDIQQRFHTIYLKIVDNSSFADVLLGNDETLELFLASTDGDRQCTADRLQMTVKSQFAYQHVLVKVSIFYLSVSCQYSDSQR